MSLFINTNVASLIAQNNVANSQSALTSSIQRLSSGMRINSAKDDAAGYAISARMTSQIGGMTQAAQNSNDGISMAQTAAGALNQVTSDLQSMRNLAVQAANGTNSASDRTSLQASIAQLQQDIGQIASNTQYNGLNLLDGSLSNVQFQVGANSGQTINTSIATSKPSAIGDNYSSTSSNATATSMDAATAVAGTIPTVNNFTAQVLNIAVGGQTLTVPPTGTLNAGSTAYNIASQVNNAASASGASITAVANTYAKLGSFTAGSVSLTLQGAPDAAGGANQVTISASLSSANDVGGLAAAINAVSSRTGISAVASTVNGTISLHQSQGYNIGVSNGAASTGVLSFSGSTETGTVIGTTQTLVNGAAGAAATAATAQGAAFTGTTITSAAAATQAVLTGAAYTATATTSGTDTLSVTVDGVAKTVALATGTTTTQSTAAQFVTLQASAFLAAGLTLTSSGTSLVVTDANAAGASSTIGSFTSTTAGLVTALGLGGAAVQGTAAVVGNDALAVTVNGAAKNITLAGGTTTTAAAFVTANASAFTTAGLTLSASGGGLLVTDATTGATSTLSAFTGTGATATGLGTAALTQGAARIAAASNSSTVGGEVDFHSSNSYTITPVGANTTFLASATSGTSSLHAVSTIDVTQMVNGLPSGANDAMFVVDGAINTINGLQAQLGALQNRFSNAQSSLTTTSTNMQQARSRIQDTDFASETANLTHNQILQQAGIAMLAQANSMPNSVLTLLK